MAKDPAFLFYYQDFLVGTDDMDNDEVGAYIRCLCHQASKGNISEKHMMKICLTLEVYDIIKSKFEIDDNGNYINKRLQHEIFKRVAFSESRRNNRLKKPIEKDMIIISNSYDKHMENENENENENKDVNRKKKFSKPTENEVYNYIGELNMKANNFMDENRLTIFAKEFMDYYEGNGWRVGKNPMKDWQSTARRWMRNEYEKRNNQNSNQYGKSKFDNVAHYQNLAAKIATDFAREREMREDSNPS